MADIVRVPIVEIILTAERCTDRQRVGLGEAREVGRDAGIPPTASNDDQGPLGFSQQIAEPRDIVRVGVNGRLDTLQAAVLLAKLPALRTEQSRREQLSRRYDAALAGAARLPARRDAYVAAWAQYTIQVPQRDRLQQRLSDVGIPTQIYYPRPMHLQPAYRPYGGGEGSLPVAERLSQTVLSLPMHPYMPGDVADYICEHLSQIVSAYAEG